MLCSSRNSLLSQSKTIKMTPSCKRSLGCFFAILHCNRWCWSYWNVLYVLYIFSWLRSLWSLLVKFSKCRSKRSRVKPSRLWWKSLISMQLRMQPFTAFLEKKTERNVWLYICFRSEFSIVLYFETFRMLRAFAFFCGATFSTYLSQLA